MGWGALQNGSHFQGSGGKAVDWTGKESEVQGTRREWRGGGGKSMGWMKVKQGPATGLLGSRRNSPNSESREAVGLLIFYENFFGTLATSEILQQIRVNLEDYPHSWGWGGMGCGKGSCGNYCKSDFICLWWPDPSIRSCLQMSSRLGGKAGVQTGAAAKFIQTNLKYLMVALHFKKNIYFFPTQ